MGVLFDRELVINAGGLRIASRSSVGFSQPLLRAQFKIVRSLKNDPNTADVTLYNLNPENRVRLQQKEIPTTIDAGYADNVSQIFGGVLQFGSSTKQGTDWITTMQSSDSGQKFKSARVNISLKGPVSIGDVMKEVGKALGINLGNLNDKANQGSQRSGLQEFTNGVVLSGKAEKVFSKIMKKAGLSWSAQNGSIQILAPKEVIDERAVVLTTEDGKSTGLIGSPEPGEKGFVRARSLLQPDLSPGRKVKIESREVDGLFRVDKVVFTGDTWGGDWYSDIEAMPL